MTEIDNILDDHLFTWFDYMAHGSGTYLGYSRKSTIQTMMLYGGRVDYRPANVMPEIPRNVQIVDAAMLALKQYSENLYQSVVVYLIDRTTHRSRAKRLKISADTFQQRLKQARCFLAGRLLNFEDGH